MPWTRLDDRFHSNPKILGLSHVGFRLYVSGMNWSVSNLTDGHIPPYVLALLLPHTKDRARANAPAELVDAGLWKPRADGWDIHDFHEYQETRDAVEERRSRWNRSKAVQRDASLQEAIKARDGDVCRFCGVTVDWANRSGLRGATYDHIDPEGPNTLDNLALACRSCNSQKGRKHPDEWKRLRPVSEDKPRTNRRQTEDPVRTRVPIPKPKETSLRSVSADDEHSINRNGVWTALEDLFGVPASSDRTLRGKVVKSLAGVGATYSEVKARAAVWPNLFSKDGKPLTLTPTALEAHWGQLGKLLEVETKAEVPCSVCDSRRIVGFTKEGEVVKVDDPRAVVNDRCVCVAK